MAKRVHSVQLKGNYYHDNVFIEEVNKEDVKYYKLLDILKEFDQKQISITIKEEGEVQSVDEPIDSDE